MNKTKFIYVIIFVIFTYLNNFVFNFKIVGFNANTAEGVGETGNAWNNTGTGNQYHDGLGNWVITHSGYIWTNIGFSQSFGTPVVGIKT